MSELILSIEGTEAGARAAVLLALLAAVLHAVFGALQKGRHDPLLARGAIDAAYGLMAAPLAVFVVPWPEPHMWPIFAGAFVIHSLYKWATLAAYRRAAFAVVYPVMRGTGPVFAVFGAWLVFGETFSGVQWLGLGVLLAGLYGLALYNMARLTLGRETLMPALGFGVRFWPLGLALAAAVVARVVAKGLVYASETSVPRWSKPPTALLWVVQTAAAGLLGLSAVEGLLGFPPGLVVWKAALALIGLGLMSQLWHAQAGEAGDDEAPWLRTDSLAQQARQRALWLFRGAIFFGLGVPMVLAIAADGQTERVLMPLAFVSHLAGLAMHRLLFFAEARERRAPQ
jgi:drug/metabolite transporter (DMT)-like permease